MLTVYSNHPGGNLVHKLKAVKFDLVGEQPATRHYPNQPNRLKRVEKLHRLKSQPIFSKASQTEWREPFDFPTGTVYLVNFILYINQGQNGCFYQKFNTFIMLFYLNAVNPLPPNQCCL